MSNGLSYPVSVLMKLLHDLIVVVADPATGAAWILTIVLVVGVVRFVLLVPAWRQQVSARRAAVLQPRLAELRRRHRGDQAAYLRAASALQRQEGVTLGASILPVLIQLPMFFGLYHLLAGFTRAGAGGNGVFSAAEVASFAHATLFGVPLSATVRAPATALAALSPGLTASGAAAVILPLAAVAALVTFVGLWWSRRHQVGTGISVAATTNRVSMIMMWASPVGLAVAPLLFPVPLALVVYWVVNGTWTTAQSVLMGLWLDRLHPLPS